MVCTKFLNNFWKWEPFFFASYFEINFPKNSWNFINFVSETFKIPQNTSKFTKNPPKFANSWAENRIPQKHPKFCFLTKFCRKFRKLAELWLKSVFCRQFRKCGNTDPVTTMSGALRYTWLRLVCLYWTHSALTLWSLYREKCKNIATQLDVLFFPISQAKKISMDGFTFFHRL